MHSSQIESLLEHAEFLENDGDPLTAAQVRAVIELLRMEDSHEIRLTEHPSLQQLVENWVEPSELILRQPRGKTVVIEINPHIEEF